MTQTQRVVAWIRANPGTTVMELQLALHPFVSNPRARISDARAAGHVIECARRFDGQMGFRLIEAPEQLEMRLTA